MIHKTILIQEWNFINICYLVYVKKTQIKKHCKNSPVEYLDNFLFTQLLLLLNWGKLKQNKNHLKNDEIIYTLSLELHYTILDCSLIQTEKKTCLNAVNKVNYLYNQYQLGDCALLILNKDVIPVQCTL